MTRLMVTSSLVSANDLRDAVARGEEHDQMPYEIAAALSTDLLTSGSIAEDKWYDLVVALEDRINRLTPEEA